MYIHQCRINDDTSVTFVSRSSLWELFLGKLLYTIIQTSRALFRVLHQKPLKPQSGADIHAHVIVGGGWIEKTYMREQKTKYAFNKHEKFIYFIILRLYKTGLAATVVGAVV